MAKEDFSGLFLTTKMHIFLISQHQLHAHNKVSEALEITRKALSSIIWSHQGGEKEKKQKKKSKDN